jgi:hypothetical protein
MTNMTIRFFVRLDDGFDLDRVWVRNQGAACTSACVLIALGILGVPGLPPLGEATRLLGAAADFGAPAVLDYVSLPGRRAPLDLRVERLAAERGVGIRSRTGLVPPRWTARAAPGEVLVAHLLYGQEAPGRYGFWGFRLLERASWGSGGHSVVVLGAGPGGWSVLDPNLPGAQRWSRPGVAVTATRLKRALPPAG